METNFDAELKRKIADVEAVLAGRLPQEVGFQKTIFTAMSYSLMAGGKRLRPLLMSETAEFFGGAKKELLEPFMTAIEMIHTYSLIHDDLPALDNDDFRRGSLTSHKMFGEAMAILAGDALLNYAFEVAASAFDAAADEGELARVAKAMQILTHKPGIYGMIGGQVVDVELTGAPMSEEVLRFVFELKTGALLEASMMIGACLAGAGKEALEQIEQVAHDIGMAFQIQDDILDVTSSMEELGKPVHSDEKNDKTTWVTLFGLEKAKEDVKAYSEQALQVLTNFGQGRDMDKVFLYDLVRWLIHRTY